MMELRVDVTSPSSSSNGGYGLPANSPYEQVDFREIAFPNFQQMKRLGRGSYGTVVQAQFRNKSVAIKLLDADLDHTHIHNEAKILSSFKHNNIIKIFAAFHGEQSGLILELMEGGSLHELIHNQKHINYYACHIVGWAQQVLDALGYLHNLQLVHRDLKPLNMLLTNDFITLKLCDFGTAAELRTSMTNNRGSAAWMAPEVFRGKKYNQKCDIFSFGILMWEIVARKQPFDDWDSHAYTILWQVSEGRRPHNIRNCPKPLMDLIRLCWSDVPKERPTVDGLISAIECLCHIYPNRYIPLTDRTTGFQAFAHPMNHTPPYINHSASPFIPAPSPHPYNTSSQNNTIQSRPPPIPPAPRIKGHYRTGSHDLNTQKTQTNSFYNQPYSPASTQPNIPQGQTVGYSPMVSNPMPPTPPSYRHNYHNVNNHTPPIAPPKYSAPNLQVPSGELHTRRSSEPPLSNDGGSVGKKKGKIRSLINGIIKH